ncbi:MAG: putative Ig domain-containing protein [Nitrospira sp.]
MALLTAFLQSMQAAQSGKTLNDVTFKLTSLVEMIFSRDLYRFDTDTPNRNLLERLVQNEQGNAMVTRFTEDLWKLAQDGGLTMADDAFASVKLVSQTLIAFAMQMYYENTTNATTVTKELFTGVSGGIQFDREDVSSSLTTTKGYSLYFHNYLANAFTPSDRDRIENLLTSTSIRDWYVQAGTSGMNATDTQNRGAFMLGGLGADSLTGGTGNDLLVGNVGHDRLTGGAGTDTLMGGEGFDAYYYTTGNGNDRIEDSDARGMIVVNGQVLLGGVKKTGHTDWESADGRITYVMSGTDLVVKLDGTQILTVNENFQSGQLGIRLIDVSEANYNNGLPTNTFPGTAGDDIIATGGIAGTKNYIVNAGAGNDFVLASANNDQLFGEFDNDQMYGNAGDDRLYGGSGNDFLVGDNAAVLTSPDGNDLVDGGEGTDTLVGGFGHDVLDGGEGNDVLWGDYDAIYPGKVPGSLSQDDFLDGGAGDDELHGGDGDDVLYGGAGNDFLSGEADNDVEDGGAGDDLLLAYTGDDLLAGGTGLDTLYGDQGNDILDGGDDADTLHGGDGADDLYGGAANDILFGDGLNNPSQLSTAGGADVLDGGDGNDHLEGGFDDDILFGGTGNDVLFGQEGADSLFGDVGDDVLQGGTEADALWGGAGDDQLQGGDGEDVLIGGTGDDVLDGGAGNDTYVFNLGDGVETIDDAVGINRLVFGAGIAASDVTLGYGSLLLRVGPNGDLIHIQNFNSANPAQSTGIESFEFADGTVLTHAQLIERGFDLIGTTGNDVLDGAELYQTIYGLGGNDVLTGGSLNNVLYGGTGDDQLSGNAGNDQLLGEAGSDTLLGGEGDDVLEGGAEDDQLYGGVGADQLHGGTGNDRLEGGAGNDTYRFNLGDGLDSISDSIDTGELNQVVFGPGITASSVTLTTYLGQVLVRPGAAFEGVTVGANTANVLGSHAVDNFKFADGTTLTYAQLIARGFDIAGTDGGDVLSGTNVTDRINGHGGADSIQADAGNDRIDAGAGDDVVDAGDGNDTVVGGDGNDTIFAGAGNDTIVGGAGDDTMYGQGGVDVVDGGSGNDRFVGALGTYTYAFGTGSGHDIIESHQGGTYTIQMSADVVPGDVTVGRVGRTITLNLNGGLDTLTLPTFYVNHSFQVQFADGAVWSAATIHNQAGDSRQVGTSEADYLLGYKGFPDELIGLAGDDTYEVNDPSDVVMEAPNEGHDIISSSADFTLPDNVEDLRLVEPFALYEFTSIEIGTILVYVDPPALLATGNALDNVLTGNSYDNVITGGAGDDTLDGGNLIYGHSTSTSNDDTLIGGSGNDTYYYDAWWGGIDTIIDQSVTGEPNTLIFRNLITLDPLVGFHLRLDGTTLVMQMDVEPSSIVENTREVRFPDFNPADAYGPHAIDVFDFQDGHPRTYQQIIDLGIDVQGTSHDDMVTGTNAPNRFHGGAGHDTLIGNLRHDIYFYDQGDGTDTIVDTAVPGAMNEIRFGQGINLGDLDAIAGSNVLTITMGNNSDAIVLSNYDPTGQTGSSVIGSVTFANGLHLTLHELFNFPGGTNGDDSFIGTDGADRYNAKGGNDVVVGEGGNDLLFGGFGQDILEGDAGADQLFGGVGDDQLDGGIDADALEGGSGNDRLIGGSGNDALDGGAGSDVYVFNPGGGWDVIHDSAESGENNRLLFGPGITLSNLDFGLDGPSVEQLTIRFISIVYDVNIGNTGDVIELPNTWGVDPGLRTLSFADGLTVDLFDYYFASRIQADQNLVVSPGHDTLIGGAGNDTLHGGAGNSVLIGGGGSNTMIGGTGHTTFYSQSAANNQIFFGSGSNVLVISGGSSRDTVHPLGTPASNTVIFAGSYESFAPNLGFGSLLIRYGANGGELHIEGFDPNDAYANPGIGTFQFTDRTLMYQELIDLGFDILGTNDIDVLTGSSATDRIKGLGGNDTLQSGLGADVLEGGRGGDLLRGGGGNDQYIFNLGDGIDTVEDSVAAGEGNRIQFGEGITQSALTFTHDDVARTLTIHVGISGTDQLVLTNFDPTGANGSLVVETLAFADGTTARLSALLGGPLNHAPTVANPLVNQTVLEDAPFSITVPVNTFTDPDAGDALTYSATLADGHALPSWLSFDATTRTFTGIPDDAQVGTLNLTVTATDPGGLSAVSSFALTVQNVNEAPTVVNALANQTTFEDAPFSFVVPANTFADPDLVHGDTLTYSATFANGNALPSWLSFNAATRTFSGTPLNGDVGTLSLVVRATDVGGLNTTSGFTLTVQNVNDTPTVATPLANQTVLEDAPLSMTVPANTFADPDAGDTLTYSATLANGHALPSWLSFDAVTRSFTGMPDDAQVGSLALKVTATDSGSLSVSNLFTLTIQNVNEAPMLVVPLEDQQATQGTAFSFVVPVATFVDVDAGDSLSYSATLANGAGLPTWLSFDPTTRMLSGTPQSSDVGLMTIQLSAIDSGNLRAFDLFELRVISLDQVLTGTTGNDVLTGGAGNDQLFGLGGNDMLTGGIGNDVLNGGTGIDIMRGGLGDDRYVVENSGDGVIEQLNEGADTVLSSVTYTLGSNVENLTLTGTGAINGTGNALNNVLLGNSASNTLNGGAGHDWLDGGLGSDTMIGGIGDDRYVVNQTGDIVIEQVGEGSDTVESAIAYALGVNVENLTLTGSAAINGTGNSANNVLIGNSGSNTLLGASGADIVNGGAGNDTILGGSGNDTLSGEDGVDIIDGGAGDDQLFGGSGNDSLIGGSGADHFTGGAGNDTVIGGVGNDQYDFSRGDGQDSIFDSDPFSGNQDRAVFGTTINPLDLVISRQANDLRLAIHGAADQVTVRDWYLSANNRIETIQAGNGQTLLSTQVDQLIQAMAAFTQQSGLTWDQAIDQRPQDVQTVLAASWQ